MCPPFVEEGSSEALATFLAAATETLIVSDLAAAEVTSALSRLFRMNVMTREQANLLLRRFEDWRVIATTGMDLQPVDVRLANSFPYQFELGLRAPDALHAAVCWRGEHRLVTLDQRLDKAGRALGLSVDCPA